MKQIKDRIADDVFIKVCETSITMAETAAKLGINYGSLKSRASELNCFLPNQSGKGMTKKFIINIQTKKYLKRIQFVVHRF